MKENSRALPAHFYRDPAEVLERAEMNELGCRACRSSSLIFTKMHCDDTRNENQTGVPRIGHRCKYFAERA